MQIKFYLYLFCTFVHHPPAPMKNFLHILILLLFGCHISLSAQTYDTSAWMARINDEQKVSSLSIPGTHDAATGEGIYLPSVLGVTQTLSIGEQWDCGVRAFDLRPAICDTTLHIYHGKLKTKISFAQALDTLAKKLTQNPTEFAIVLMREENDSEDDAEKALWPSFFYSSRKNNITNISLNINYFCCMGNASYLYGFDKFCKTKPKN